MLSAIVATTTGNIKEISGWRRATAAFESAQLDYDCYQLNVWTPLADELHRVSPRPDLWFEIEARNGQLARYHVAANNLHEWDDHISPLFRAKAVAVREAWLQHRATRMQLGYDAASDEIQRRCDLMCDRENELLTMPAPDSHALMWKLERLFGPAVRDNVDYCDSWCAAWINAVMDDARRHLGAGTREILEPLRQAA